MGYRNTPSDDVRGFDIVSDSLSSVSVFVHYASRSRLRSARVNIQFTYPRKSSIIKINSQTKPRLRGLINPKHPEDRLQLYVHLVPFPFHRRECRNGPPCTYSPLLLIRVRGARTIIIFEAATNRNSPVAGPADAPVPESTGVYTSVRILKGLEDLDTAFLGSPGHTT